MIFFSFSYVLSYLLQKVKKKSQAKALALQRSKKKACVVGNTFWLLEVLLACKLTVSTNYDQEIYLAERFVVVDDLSAFIVLSFKSIHFCIIH